MTEQFFNKVVRETLRECRDTLTIKGKEYRRNNNPLHNFEVGAEKEGVSREEVIRYFALKHEVSISDIRTDMKKGILPSVELLNEKFGDYINYLLIEKASILDKIKKSDDTNIRKT